MRSWVWVGCVVALVGCGGAAEDDRQGLAKPVGAVDSSDAGGDVAPDSAAPLDDDASAAPDAVGPGKPDSGAQPDSQPDAGALPDSGKPIDSGAPDSPPPSDIDSGPHICSPNEVRCNANVAETCTAAYQWSSSKRACTPECSGQQPGRYVVGDNATTVRDVNRSITWERAPDTAVKTFAEAATYCATLTTADAAWRLPSQTELSLLGYTSTTCVPRIDQTAFPGTLTVNPYWTATVDQDIGGHLVVSFADRSTATRDDATPALVRCVH